MVKANYWQLQTMHTHTKKKSMVNPEAALIGWDFRVRMCPCCCLFFLYIPAKVHLMIYHSYVYTACMYNYIYNIRITSCWLEWHPFNNIRLIHMWFSGFGESSFHSTKALLPHEVCNHPVFLLGRSGSGKTTVLCHAQLDIAWQQISRSSFQGPLNDM